MATLALVNEYTNVNLQNGGIDNAVFVNGGMGYFAVQNAVINKNIATSTDDDGSIYRLFVGVQDRSLIIALNVTADVNITGGVLYDVVLLRPDSSDTVATIMSGLDFSSGGTESRPVSIDTMKNLYELAGDTVLNSAGRYDIALKSNSPGNYPGNTANLTVVLGICPA